MSPTQKGRYVQVPCRACGIKALVIDGRPWPKRCIRCGAGFELESRAFAARPERPVTAPV